MKAYLEPEDIKHLEEAAVTSRDRLLIRLLFRLACRISGALAICVGDVGFTRCTITILHLKSRAKLSCTRCRARLGKRHHFCPECGEETSATATQQLEHRRVRTLPLDSDTLNMLANFIETEAKTNLIFDINRHRAWQMVRDCSRRAGLPDLVNPETGTVRGISPHRLRDAFSVHAMKLDDSGDALRLLQEHLGHASFNTTAKYRKVAGEEHRRWYNHLWVGIT